MVIVFYEKKKFNLAKCKLCGALFPWATYHRQMCMVCRFDKYERKPYVKLTSLDWFNKVFNKYTKLFKIPNMELFYTFASYITPEEYDSRFDDLSLYKSVKMALPIILLIYGRVYPRYDIDYRDIAAFYTKFSYGFARTKRQCYDFFVDKLEAANRLIRVPSREKLILKYFKAFGKLLGGIGLYKQPTTLYNKYKIDYPSIDEKVVAMTYMYYYRKRIKNEKSPNVDLMTMLCGSNNFISLERKLHKKISEIFDEIDG